MSRARPTSQCSGRESQNATPGSYGWSESLPGPVDLWLGAGGAWVWISDLESADLSASGIGRVEVKSRAAFVAGLGADFRIAPNVWLGVEGRYLPLKPDSHGASGTNQELKLNPVIVSAGFRLSL